MRAGIHDGIIIRGTSIAVAIKSISASHEQRRGHSSYRLHKDSTGELLHDKLQDAIYLTSLTVGNRIGISMYLGADSEVSGFSYLQKSRKRTFDATGT